MSATLVLIGLLVLLALGVPVGFAMLITGSIGLYALVGFDALQGVLDSSPLSVASAFEFLTIPLFLLMAEFVLRSGKVDDLFRTTAAWVGELRGGLGMATALAGAGFGAICGTSTASAATLSATSLPAMIRQGYHPSFAAGVVAISGTLALLIPPSVAMVIFAELSQQSVKSLFLAGVVPGLISAVAIGAVAFFISFRHGYGKRTEPFSLGVVWRTFVKAGPALGMPAIVLGGIYLGYTTPTEAAALSVVYGLFVGMCVYRTIGFKDLPGIFLDSARGTGSILFILSGALFVGMLATLVGIPQSIVELIAASDLSPIGFLLLANVMLIALGCFLDGFTLLTVVAPLLLPSVAALGINPIHFAIVLVLNIEIAAVTPPIGLNLFVITGISGTTMKEVAIGVAPFVLALVCVLLLLTFTPYLSLLLL